MKQPLGFLCLFIGGIGFLASIPGGILLYMLGGFTDGPAPSMIQVIFLALLPALFSLVLLFIGLKLLQSFNDDRR